jgi:luciferase family oxidoreductase group 1
MRYNQSQSLPCQRNPSSVIKLSILDQSPVRKGGSAEDALAETLELATFADTLGYHRFWVSEHHSTAAYAGSAPEVLLAAIGARTSSIRIGSGGIMLPHYSTFKVAEVASLLSTLFPGRIDLGLGRAPGADMATARELARGNDPQFHNFPSQVNELLDKLDNHAYRPKIFPRPATNPDPWMLGSSPDSARLAASLGLPYNFAIFINADIDTNILRLYRQQFRPSTTLEKPHTCLTINVYCADTEEQAQQLALARHLSMLRVAIGRGFSGIDTVEAALNYPFTPDESQFTAQRSRHDAVGTPEQVRERIHQLAELFDADEIMTVTITHDFKARLRSYELLAELMLADGNDPLPITNLGAG